MSRFDNNLIFEAYTKKTIPLEENIAVLLKNDIIISQKIYNEWDMKKAFSGGFSKGASNIISGAKDFLQDKVNKYIVKPLLSKIPGILGEFSKCNSKECIGQVLSRYRGEAEKIISGVNSKNLQLDSFGVGEFWELIISEAKDKEIVIDDKLKKSILEIGNSLGDGGAETLLKVADGDITLDEVDGNDNLKRLCKLVAKMVENDDERVEGVSKLASVIKGIESKLNPDDSDYEGKYGPIINSILSNKFFIANDERAIGKSILKSDKEESDTSIVPKGQETQADKKEEAKPENVESATSLKKVRAAIQKVSATKGKQAEVTKNKLQKLYKGASRIADIIKGHEEAAVNLTRNPKKVKVQQAQAVTSAISGNKPKRDAVKAVMAAAVGIATEKLPSIKKTVKGKKSKTSKPEQKSEKEFYQSVPELFRLLNFVVRSYTPFIKDFVSVVRTVQPSIKSLELTSKSETPEKPEIDNDNIAIKVLSDQNSDDASVIGAFKYIHPKLKEKSDDTILKFINQYTAYFKQMGEQKFKTKFIETLLKSGIDKKFHEAIFNLIKNRSSASNIKGSSIGAEFTMPDTKEGEIVQSNDPIVSGKTPEQLKQDIIDLIAKNVPDKELHDDVLRAFQNSEERIKKAKDEEERARQLEELKNFLISKGFASEQNINHVMAAIAHMSKGGFVRPMDSRTTGASNEPTQKESGSLKDRINKMGKQSLFRILYDIISDKQQMMSLATGMGILFICFLLFGPAFLGLLYVAAKAKQSDQNQGQDQQEDDESSQEQEEKSDTGILQNMKNAASNAASTVRNTVKDAITNYTTPKTTQK
jgi:hypothetical protein